MLQRPLLRRALARVDGLLRHRAGSSSPSPPVPRSRAPAAETTGEDARPAGIPPRELVPTPAAPLAPHHRRGLELARARRWSHAQRELELAARAEPVGPAVEDLASVRAARRQLRLLAKWPRDPGLYVALGRAYLELELGEEAEGAFRRAIALAPEEPAAHFYLALEYAYRGACGEAASAYARAQALADGLPPFAEFLAEWRGGAEGRAGGRAGE